MNSEGILNLKHFSNNLSSAKTEGNCFLETFFAARHPAATNRPIRSLNRSKMHGNSNRPGVPARSAAGEFSCSGKGRKIRLTK